MEKESNFRIRPTYENPDKTTLEGANILLGSLGFIVAVFLSIIFIGLIS